MTEYLSSILNMLIEMDGEEDEVEEEHVMLGGSDPELRGWGIMCGRWRWWSQR